MPGGGGRLSLGIFHLLVKHHPLDLGDKPANLIGSLEFLTLSSSLSSVATYVTGHIQSMLCFILLFRMSPSAVTCPGLRSPPICNSACAHPCHTRPRLGIR